MECQKHLFELDGKGIYLNGAYMSPLLIAAKEAGINGMLRKANPQYLKSSDFFEPADRIRKLFARLINIEEPDRIVLSPSASYGLANIASNIVVPDGHNIIVTGEQFPSNYYCWEWLANKSGAKIKIVNPPEPGIRARSKVWNEKIIESIDEKTSVVAIPHVHWTDGTLFNLQNIRKRLNDTGGYLIIDGTQSIGAFPFDNRLVAADGIVVSAYKWLLGPYGISLSYMGPRFDNGEPIERSWLNKPESDDFANLIKYKDAYRPAARRYEVGEAANFILVPMLEKSLQLILSLTPEVIQNYCKNISEDCINTLREFGYLIPDQGMAHHLFGIRHTNPALLDSLKLKLESNDIKLSYRGSSIRVSPGIYNTREEMNRFTEILSI